jgi:hypothetical protein
VGAFGLLDAIERSEEHLMSDRLSYTVPERRARRRDLTDELRAQADAAERASADQRRGRTRPAKVIVHVHNPPPQPEPPPPRVTPPAPVRVHGAAAVAVRYQQLRKAGIDARLIDTGMGVDVPNHQIERARKILAGGWTDA